MECRNGIFEIFEAEYDHHLETRKSSSKNTDGTLDPSYLNLFNKNENFRDKISEEGEWENEGESNEIDDTVSYGQTPQNEIQVRRLMEKSNKFIKIRRKLSNKNHMKLKLGGGKSLKNLYQVVNRNNAEIKTK